MTDGRHTGTGGGNHFCAGGATPFRQRPSCASRSCSRACCLLAQPPQLELPVQRPVHRPDQPGPTHRRGRNDQLYELEIALEQIARNRELHGESMPPWLVDRTLRNILIDVTGNTHRSEFSIDKLYSPDSATGRLACSSCVPRDAAARAHEHRAATAAARAGGALLAAAPGGQAHALGHRAARPLPAADLREDGLRRRARRLASFGYAFDPPGSAPHFEFRFPPWASSRRAASSLAAQRAEPGM